MNIAVVVINTFIIVLGIILLSVWWTAKPRYLTDWLAGIIGWLMLFSLLWKWLQ